MLVETELQNVLQAVRGERERQELLKNDGRFQNTPDEVELLDSYAMLSEEVGEVARSILGSMGRVQEQLTVWSVREELVQVAAIAVAMIEGIDRGYE